MSSALENVLKDETNLSHIRIEYSMSANKFVASLIVDGQVEERTVDETLEEILYYLSMQFSA